MFTQIKSALKAKVNPQGIIRDIHNSFDEANEIILMNAKDVIEKSKASDEYKATSLANLGFKSSKTVTETESILRIKRENEFLANRILHYRTVYPFNKFITGDVVKKICAKYNLVLAAVRHFKGDVPDKNIKEMESFVLRDEDKLNSMERHIWDAWYDRSESSINYGRNKEKEKTGNGYIYDAQFYICAPASDFNMSNLERKGHVLSVKIPDPIVLQPVKDGYLIVTKWGLEASDETLVNEINN